MNAIKRYQQTSEYGELARFLYSQNIPNDFNLSKENHNLLHWTKELNDYLKNGSEMKLFRGVRHNFYNKNELVNKSFISTSKSLNKAAMFSNIVIQFILPKHIKSFSFKYKNKRINTLNEEEVLIERNTKFTNIIFEKKLGNIFLYSAKLIKFYKPRNSRWNNELECRRKQIVPNSNDESSNFSN